MVTGDAPGHRDHARGGRGPHRRGRSIEGLPNNGRNFLDFTKLTPGVAIVQGPDGDELTINGQKGIHNNISVDGADFNNPFFGEQRGGQRPAFTFNLDAVKEIVVVAEGANAEFGRASARLRQRGDQVGHQRRPRQRARLPQERRPLLARPSSGRRHLGRQVRLQPVADRLHPRRAAAAGPALLLPGLRLPGRPAPPSRPTRSRIEQRRGGLLRQPGQPERERPHRAHQRRPRVPGQAGLAGLRQTHLLTLRYNYTWSEQEQRHLRRRLLGPQRERDRAGLLPRGHGLRDLEPVREPS